MWTGAPLLLFVLVFCSMMLVSVGLPLYRQERGTGEDIIAGEAFLSMLMGSRSRSRPREMRLSTPSTASSTVELTTEKPETTNAETVRETRSSPYVPQRTFTEPPSDKLNNLDLLDSKPSESSANPNTMIISVRVSSSVAEKGNETDNKELKNEASVKMEEHPSLISEANKSEFSVDEGEPITTQYEELPSPMPLTYDYTEKKPYQVIYHNNPREPSRARSVSYNTGIQNIQNNPVNETKSTAESKNYFVTKYPKYYTERNWATPSYPPVYAPQPEQNYEVDESVSVETNGRAHGVQEKKKDDNQKVGYVVEGRNYRKYRVEERTSDGFIVGEYGVVSHDDGSLRGVRYTADGTISPRLIYDALMKFLSL